MAKENLTSEEKAAAALKLEKAAAALKLEEAAAAKEAAAKDAEIAELKAKLAESKAKEEGASLKVEGVYKSSEGGKYKFKNGYIQTRMKGSGLITDSAALIVEANKKDGDPAAKETMEHLVSLGYAGLEEVK